MVLVCMCVCVCDIPAYTPCRVDNGGCSHICVAKHSPNAPKGVESACLCPVGLKLLKDKKNCQDGKSNILKIIMYSDLWKCNIFSHFLLYVRIYKLCTCMQNLTSFNINGQSDVAHWWYNCRYSITLSKLVTQTLWMKNLKFDWITKMLDFPRSSHIHVYIPVTMLWAT